MIPGSTKKWAGGGMLVANKDVELPRWICAVLVGCGLLAYAITAVFDVFYQISTTINSVGAAGMAAGMCILSGLAVGFASAAGFVFRRQKRLSGLLLLAIAGAFMSYSMANCVGFVASQSLAKAKLTEARRQQNSDLAGLQNQQAIETQNWLKRTYLQTKDKAEKDKLLAQAVAPVELKAANIETVMPDARATVLAAIFHVDEATVQFTLAIMFPVLLVLGKVFGPLIGFALWPIRKPEASTAGSAGGNRNVGNAGNSGEIVKFPTVSEISAWKHQAKSTTSPTSLSDSAANDDLMETPLVSVTASNVSNTGSIGVSKCGNEFPSRPIVSNGAPPTLTGTVSNVSTAQAWKHQTISRADETTETSPVSACSGPSVSMVSSLVSKISTGRKLTKAEALTDLRKLMAELGAIPSQRVLATRWKVPPGTVSKWCQSWERSGEIGRRSSGNCTEVVEGFQSVHRPGRA
jgi:hypothetical protein